MARYPRLDAELVRRGLARSRGQAADLVDSGQVLVAGRVAHKPATQVPQGVAISVTGRRGADYVSRGGYKLAGALEALAPRGLTVTGRRCLDAGASTGGFTDVLLRAGAREVVAADVGYGQLAWTLRVDPRVRVYDRTNVRELTAVHIGGAVDLVVADLSFISLRLVLPALAGLTVDGGDLLVMVKPQFEVGRGRVGAGGVVRDPRVRADAVRQVAHAAAAQQLRSHAVVPSPLPGPAGNVEYFLWLSRPGPLDPTRPAPLDGDQLDQALDEAVRVGLA